MTTGIDNNLGPRAHPFRGSLLLPTVVISFATACGPEVISTPACGDGVKSSDELCDDGNRTAGDGCSPECVPSGSYLECFTVLEGHSAEGHSGNWANALLSLSDRSFMIAGQLNFGNDERGWLGRYDASGELVWFQQLEDHRSVVDLAPDGQDGNWALLEGATELMHFDGGGNLERTVNIFSTFGVGPLGATAIEYVDGSVWIAGSVSGDTSLDLWLGRYDSTSGQATTLLLEDHLGFDDGIHALGRSNTEVVVAATVSTSPNYSGDVILTARTDILLVRFDLQGNELDRVLWASKPESEFARVAKKVVSDGQGGWYIGGSDDGINPTLFEPQSWVRWVKPSPNSGEVPDSDDNWVWTSHGLGAFVSFGDVAAVADGDVILAAGAFVDGVQEGWLARIGLGGEVGWRQSNTFEEHPHYAEQRITVDSGGRIRVVGRAWTGGPSSSSWSSSLKSCLVAW